MENKKLYIGLGIAAIAGFAIWHLTKNNDKKEDKKDVSTETKSPVDGDCGCGCKGEQKSKVQGVTLNSCYESCIKDTGGNIGICKSQCGSSRKIRLLNKNNNKSSFCGNAHIYQGREVVSMATPYIPYNRRKPFFYAY